MSLLLLLLPLMLLLLLLMLLLLLLLLLSLLFFWICKQHPQVQGKYAAQIIGANRRQKFHRPRSPTTRRQSPPVVR